MHTYEVLVNEDSVGTIVEETPQKAAKSTMFLQEIKYAKMIQVVDKSGKVTTYGNCDDPYNLVEYVRVIG